MYHLAVSCLVMHRAGGISVWSYITKRGFVACALYFAQECGVCGGVLEFEHHIEWIARETTTVESVEPRELLGHRRVFVGPSESSQHCGIERRQQ